MLGKYSPTVSYSYVLDQNWHNKMLDGDPVYDIAGYDSYGYNEDGLDRSGHTEHDYTGNEDLYDHVRSKYSVNLKEDVHYSTVKAMGNSSCPCTHGEPCSSQCTCANGVMSGGCYRCCRYGSPEQRKAMAEDIIKRERIARDLAVAAKEMLEAQWSYMCNGQIGPEGGPFEPALHTIGCYNCPECKRRMAAVEQLEKILKEIKNYRNTVYAFPSQKAGK